MTQGYAGNMPFPKTGSGNVVLATSPTITTPNIIGITDASNAASGSVGEFVSSVVLSGSAVAMTTNVAANVTSISLTAGDWDLQGEVWITAGATTSITIVKAGITTSSATIPTVPATSTSFTQFSSGNGGAWIPGSTGIPMLPIAPCRISINSTTTIYLVSVCTFTISTCSTYGKITARRVR